MAEGKLAPLATSTMNQFLYCALDICHNYLMYVNEYS